MPPNDPAKPHPDPSDAPRDRDGHGDPAHEGIPANGTRPVAPQGPDEIGA